MRVTVQDRKEFAAGLIFTVVGIGWGAASLLYPMGQATAMGPGYFPLMVSILLAFLGICSTVRAVRAEDMVLIGAWKIVPLLFVLAGVAFFAIFIERAGLVVSTVGLVVISSYKRVLSRPIEVAIVALVTTVFVSILFIKVLQLSFDLFWF